MNALIGSGVEMTSLDIAEIVGKRHDHVMRDIRNEIKELGKEISFPIFGESTYKSERGREYPCYTFGKEGAMQLALKYDATTRHKVIKRIEELENRVQLPTTYKQALRQLLEVVEENDRLEEKNKELLPKASYYDLVLQNKSLLSVSQIAKDYGMSATALNKKLHELGIQYKQGGVWMLYAKYQNEGYTQSSTHLIDSDKSKILTKWTQSGRLFIYETLKKEGISPRIERDLQK